MLNYESKVRPFPPRRNLEPRRAPFHHLNITYGDYSGNGQGKFGPSWVVLILPEAGQQTVYDTFDLNKYINDDNYTATHGVHQGSITAGPRDGLSVMLCPSDRRTIAPRSMA